MQLRRLGLLLFLIFPAAFAVEPMDLTFAVPAVALIVGIFLALSNMLATAIADPKLEAWAKTELREFIAGLILIALVTAFVISSSGLSVALTGETDYIGAAQGVMDSWIGNYDDAFAKVIGAATRIRTAATYSPYMNIPAWWVSLSYSTAPISGVGILLGTLNLATQALTNAIFVSEGIRLLLSFLNVTIPTIFLPLAFCFRLIPFTRRLGTTLIAVSIAGMVFLPFSVILADSLNDNIDFPEPSIRLNALDARPLAMVMFEPICESKPIRLLFAITDVGFALIVCLPLLLSVFGAAAYPGCYNLVKEVVYPIILNVFQIVNAVFLTVWESAFIGAGARTYANTVFNTIHPFLRDVNNLVFIGYLDFILIAIITIVGARSLSTALGGEWYMAGIQRLI